MESGRFLITHVCYPENQEPTTQLSLKPSFKRSKKSKESHPGSLYAFNSHSCLSLLSQEDVFRFFTGVPVPVSNQMMSFRQTHEESQGIVISSFRNFSHVYVDVLSWPHFSQGHPNSTLPYTVKLQSNLLILTILFFSWPPHPPIETCLSSIPFSWASVLR